MLHIGIITLFPEIFEGLKFGVVSRALTQELIRITYFNPRNFAENKHGHIDDRPYGGGPGMVMQPGPLMACINEAKKVLPDARVIYLTPQGELFKQHMAKTSSTLSSLILLCGRYEGIDERVIIDAVDHEWSIGDYVLSGGELPALVVIDALARLIPGVLGDENSALEDSFSAGLLDCPHYTRPENFNGHPVPEVLLSGNHADIAKWRLQQSLGRTWERRPELIKQLALTPTQQTLLDVYIQQVRGSKK